MNFFDLLFLFSLVFFYYRSVKSSLMANLLQTAIWLCALLSAEILTPKVTQSAITLMGNEERGFILAYLSFFFVLPLLQIIFLSPKKPSKPFHLFSLGALFKASFGLTRLLFLFVALHHLVHQGLPSFQDDLNNAWIHPFLEIIAGQLRGFMLAVV